MDTLELCHLQSRILKYLLCGYSNMSELEKQQHLNHKLGRMVRAKNIIIDGKAICIYASVNTTWCPEITSADTFRMQLEQSKVDEKDNSSSKLLKLHRN
uniref:Transposase n=1 Tax=Heterorhabditis bacteriophora TaxID=37862 RepID=A0A1I7WRV9_HETBA